MQSRGQLASSMFRHIYLDDVIWQPHPDVRELALRAYRGSGDYGGVWGRGVYEAKEGHVWAEFDATSAYPSACIALGSLPVRQSWLKWDETQGNKFSENGLYRAQVTWPHDAQRRPLMAIVPDGHGGETFAYPQQAVDAWTGYELAAAQRLGAQVRIISGFWFEEGSGTDALPRFQADLRKQRQHAQKRGDKALASLYKALGNTLIGKLGQNQAHTGIELAWDEAQGAAAFNTAARHYATLGSVFSPEWWCLIVGKARAAMMEAIISRDAIHAQVDAVLIEVPEDLQQFECGGLTFRRKAAGRVLKLAQRNQWAFEDCGEIVRFAAGGGRDIPELRAVMRRWDGTETLRQEWQDRRLITLMQHAARPAERPLMSPVTRSAIYEIPALDVPADDAGRVRKTPQAYGLT